ncbi:MAG: DedA family protein [Bacteroidales bacterium]|nr:DedA family protein [Bacteroidales bacterium]
MDFLQSWGYWGLFAGSFLSATVVPFSSDFLIVAILMAGGRPLLSFAFATAGNWLGGLTSYALGRAGKWYWIEKYLHVSEEKLLKQKSKIDRFGVWLALLTWTPIAGDVFAIALGFYRVNFTKSAIFMLIGRALRFAFWIGLFLLLGENAPMLNF